MPLDNFLADYNDVIHQTIDDRLHQILVDDLLANSPIYLAHAAGISLPYHYKDDNYRQANLDYLATYYPEYLI